MNVKLSAAPLAAIVVVLATLMLGACGSTSSPSATDSADQGATPTEPLLPESSELCPDSEIAAPELLVVGEVIELPDNGRQHMVCASYDYTPPASGAHFPAWQNCGIYDRPVQAQTAVHSLEHGAVWVAYRPDLDSAMVQAITDQLRSERFALVAPYPGLANNIVLTAWTRQLAADDWSDPAVDDFLDKYMGRYSPVAPEAGASCGQAVGSAPAEPNLHYLEILDQVS